MSKSNDNFPLSARQRSIHPSIIDCDDAQLRRVSVAVDMDNKHLAVKCWTQLEQAMESIRESHQFRNCLGLSAVQIGIPLRMCVVWTPNGGYEYIANPEILEYSSQTATEFEGCLSFFDVRGQVRRPTDVLVRYLQKDFAERTQTFTGWAARTVQHEIDHMNGILYTDRMQPNEHPIPYEDYLILRAAS